MQRNSPDVNFRASTRLRRGFTKYRLRKQLVEPTGTVMHHQFIKGRFQWEIWVRISR
jgi:hypothetical protein